MTSTPTTTADGPEAAPAVEQAEQQAAEAERALTAMEERVRDGDEDVTPAQLAAARELGRFARLRAEAAHRKAERTAAKAAETERRRTTERALALLAEQPPQALATQYAAARDALAEFIAASDAFDDAVTEAARLLKDTGAPQCAGSPEDMEGPPASPTAPRWHAGFGSAMVDLGKGDVRNADGSGPRLAVLLDDLDRAHGIRKTALAPEFTRDHIVEQAHRARGALRPALDTLAEQPSGGAK
ncbi:hypothetical protein AB0B50_30715 [Streptomyces sp. NPDC041068]|uniref:hypothetical protein n=1 Tax=Streptomyces sp. NPDC041068 TaxID=3155130 RepID=UPI0034046291